jgi:hypothetical protein
MNVEAINERIRQKPFRPFAVETIGGSWIEVDREGDVLIYDRFLPSRIVLFTSTGVMYILEPAQISAIEAR